MCENNITHMNTLTQMARTYRSMCKQVKSTDSQIRKVRAQLNELGKCRNRIIQDMEQLRTLMDYCVITGEEPTQAKLTHTVEQMNTTISEHSRHMRPDEFYYTVGGSSVTVSKAAPGSVLGSQGPLVSYGGAGVVTTTTTTINTNNHACTSTTSAGSSLMVQDELDLLQNNPTSIP
jgi:hypothetical protein